MTLNELTHAIIGAAIKVHKVLGPGLLESAYEACLAYEVEKLGLRVERQKPVPLVYESVHLDCGFRADLLVEGLLRSRPGKLFIPLTKPNFSLICAYSIFAWGC
jgi:hypothetical protein